MYDGELHGCVDCKYASRNIRQDPCYKCGPLNDKWKPKEGEKKDEPT